MRTLILYVFHEITDNVKIFIQKGLFEDSTKEFIFIYNCPDFLTKKIDESEVLTSWSFLNKYSNVHLYIRPNIGHDFQGWNSALFLPTSSLKDKIIQFNDPKLSTEPYLYSLFDRFVCVNSTVAGPYTPLYLTTNWVDCFTSRLSDDVKMTGISVNFMQREYKTEIGLIIKAYYNIDSYDHTHLQSTVFGLDREGLEILLKYKLFHPEKQFPKDKWILICSAEIAMSTLLRHENKSLFSYRWEQGLVKSDYTESSGDMWNTHGMNIPLCEMMFIKTNTRVPTFPEKFRYDQN